jgi:signal peptidase II
MKNIKFIGLPLLGSILLIVLDQWIKYWAREVLAPLPEIPIIEGFFRFVYVENIGAAFGILEGGRWFFIPLTVIILIVIVIYYARLPRSKMYRRVRIPLVFVFAGAVGNFIDRLAHGFVTDMFEFTFITFPVFNVADACLVAGTLTLAVIMLFFMKESKEETEIAAADESMAETELSTANDMTEKPE